MQNIRDKAQLRSDNDEPHREELEGSKGVYQVRTIGGLHEAETQDLERSEMSANVVAAAKLGRTGSNRNGVGTTLTDPNQQTDDRRW